MPINQPEPTHLTPMDRAVITYHQMGQDFVALLDFYLSCHPEAERYIRTGPDYLLLFRREEDYWVIDYFGGKMEDVALFLSFMPYYLDRVAFVRYAKYLDSELRFLPTSKLIRHYGLHSEIPKIPTTATTSTTAA